MVDIASTCVLNNDFVFLSSEFPLLKNMTFVYVASKSHEIIDDRYMIDR